MRFGHCIDPIREYEDACWALGVLVAGKDLDGAQRAARNAAAA